MVTESGPPVPVRSSVLPAIVPKTSTELSGPEPLLIVVVMLGGVLLTVKELPPDAAVDREVTQIEVVHERGIDQTAGELACRPW